MKKKKWGKGKFINNILFKLILTFILLRYSALDALMRTEF